MTAEKTVLYLGTDEEFLKGIKNFSSNLKNVSISSFPYQQGLICKMCLEEPAQIVYVDFTSLENELVFLIEEIILIKRTLQFKSILFVALLDETEDKENDSYLFSSGFQLSFIKGCEIDVLMRDSFYITYGDKLGFPQLAKVRNIDKSLEAGISSTISRLSAEEIWVETDLEATDELFLKLSFFPDLKNDKFKIKTRYLGSALYPMMSTYCLEYPYASAWETESEEHLNRDTVETWLDFNIDKMDDRFGFVKIISNNTLLMNDLNKIQHSIPLFIDFVETYNVDDSFDLQYKRPKLIFFDALDEAENVNNLQTLINIISMIKSMEDYSPIIIICNHVSKTQALQKVLDYQLITATNNKLSIELFNTLIASFINKKVSKESITEHHFFALSDKRRSVDVMDKYMITSLTEHEITFYSDSELPMFTVLHFQIPMGFFATIVPELVRLEMKANRFHYMAIIHGMSENGLMRLRQFVNQIIYKPLEDFSVEHVKFVLDQIKLTKHTPSEKPAEKPAKSSTLKVEPDENSKTEAPPSAQVRNTLIKGKSKL